MSVYNINIISALVYFMVYFFAANAASPCYMLNGDLATSEFQPCNSNLPSGSNSACCNLGKSPPDICLGGGLCQRMDTIEANFAIYAVGCTDRTGKDAACPQYCPSVFAFSSCLYMQKESWADFEMPKLDQAIFYSLNPCWNGTVSSWCCNDQEVNSCCVNNSGSFAFNLTALGASNGQSHANPTGPTATVTSCPAANSANGNTTSCLVGKSTVIGSSVGAFLAGTLIAGLLGLYLASRQLRKQRQKAVPNTAAYANPTSEWRTELEAIPSDALRPGQIGAGTPKYEIDGRQVGSLRWAGMVLNGAF
jgi:hypothetical protein